MNDAEKVEAADALEKAADLLWVKGRCRGTAEDNEGRVCTTKAIALALGLPWVDGGASLAGLALSEYLAAHPDKLAAEFHGLVGRVPVALWNDSLPAPALDGFVIETVRRCAKDLRNEVEQ